MPVVPRGPNGFDPRTHFWLRRDDGCFARLCDGQRWFDANGYISHPRLDYCVPCLTCQDIYVDSVVNGGGRLLLVDDLPQNGMDTPINREYTPIREYTSQKKGYSMNSIPMATFARFYASLPSAQPRIVREARLQQATPDHYMGRDYYGALRNMLKVSHWRTNNIEIVGDALGPVSKKQKSPAKRSQYLETGRSYMDYWSDQNATYFPIPPVVISIADLNIRVRPEVGMRTDNDNLVLKLWFNQPRPKRAYRQAIQHMMDLAASDSSWRESWQPAIWDVRRKSVLQPIRLPRDFTSAIEGQAASFRHIWDSFDKEID